MPACLIDARCLQDPAYADRGVGRHAAMLLQHAREMLPGVRLLGITDSALPALSASIHTLFDQARTSAYTGALSTPCCHVQLSPMTHDPLFVARLLHHPAIPAATVVHDAIPLDEPTRGRPSAEARVDYHVSLRWLARHQLFLPISATAAGGLRDQLGVEDERIVVTGTPLSPAFEGLERGPARHVLVVAGADSRKNPECAIRAHARCASLQADRVPLIITGSYDAAWLNVQRETVRALDGKPELVQAPGHLDPAALLALYAGALCVVVPSRAEKFSLPVIEAMAAGAPVLASDIPAHRELLSGGLFPPDDDAALTRLLDQVSTPAWEAEALARQASIWPNFRARAVAGRFWSAVARLAPNGAPNLPRRRPRIAFVTPLPPDRSGVAEYSATTCGELAKHADVHVFTPTLDARAPPRAVSLGPLSALPLIASGYDRVINVLGNSLHHVDILRLALRYGGAVIQHDGRMLDFYAEHTGLAQTQQMAEQELGRPLQSSEIPFWLAGDRPPKTLFLSQIAALAEPLMLHSRASVADVVNRYGARAIHLPFSMYRSIPESALGPASREIARDRLRIGEDQVLITSFGLIRPTTAPVECIWALELLRSWGMNAHLHFVGASMVSVDPLIRLIAELELDPYVQLGAAYLSDQAYHDHLVGSDLAFQLRTTGPGSVSGALADCVAAGLRSVASESIADGMDAPSYIRRVPDAPSPVLIAEAAVELLSSPSTREERQEFSAAHGFANYVGKLLTTLDLR